MSPRPKLIRKINHHPVVSGFKPYGFLPDKKVSGSVFLHYEEYESIRLCDYEKLSQQEASVYMNVSRPTLSRIYTSARNKIAQAFVEGKRLIIEGGKVVFNNDWYTCKSCNCYFNYPFDDGLARECALCGSRNIQNCDNPEKESDANTLNTENSNR